MIALIIVCSIILLILLLLFTNIRIYIRYDNELTIIAKYLFLSLPIYPDEEEDDEEEEETENANNVKQGDNSQSISNNKVHKKKKQKLLSLKTIASSIDINTFDDFKKLLVLLKDILKLILELLSDNATLIVRKFIINVSGNDAANAAINYGVSSQLASFFFDFLESNMKVKYPSGSDTSINVNYLSTQWSANIDFKINVRLIYVISALIKYIKLVFKN